MLTRDGHTNVKFLILREVTPEDFYKIILTEGIVIAAEGYTMTPEPYTGTPRRTHEVN